MSNSLETIVEEEEPDEDNIINAEILLLDECEEGIEHTKLKLLYLQQQYTVVPSLSVTILV